MTRSRTLTYTLLWAMGSACGPSPSEVCDSVLQALNEGDEQALKRFVDPDYLDALGDRSQLLSDLQELNNVYVRRSFSRSGWETMPSLSRATASAVTHVDIELVGDGPSIRASGKMAIEFVRNGQFRVRGGLLSRLRDTLKLTQARRLALEANDVDSLASIIHPKYQQGNTNKRRLLRALQGDMRDRSVRIEPIAYHIDLRAHLVHVDEHYKMRINEQRLPPSVTRLTLVSSAGRLKIRAGLGDTASPTHKTHR